MLKMPCVQIVRLVAVRRGLSGVVRARVSEGLALAGGDVLNNEIGGTHGIANHDGFFDHCSDRVIGISEDSNNWLSSFNFIANPDQHFQSHRMVDSLADLSSATAHGDDRQSEFFGFDQRHKAR